MDKVFEYTKKVVEKFGVVGVLKIISWFFWFFLPFIVWVCIYRVFGQSYFVAAWAIPGIVVILAYIAITSLILVQVVRLDKKLMKHVEYTKSLFDKPDDPEAERNFRQECNKFIVPYLHYFPMVRFSLAGVLGDFKILHLVAIPLQAYLSYSVMVFFVINKSFFMHLGTIVSSNVPYLETINFALQPLIQNLPLLAALVFILSLYALISMIRGLHISRLGAIIETASNVFFFLRQILLPATFLISSPWTIQKRNRTLYFKPFTFPTQLPLIIQTSIRNIENKDCNVTKWSYLVKDEEDINILKRVISEQKDIPGLIKTLCQATNVQDALKSIDEIRPTLFLGTIDNRCAVAGRIEYDPEKKIFIAGFSFDNQYVKDAFRSIAEIQIQEQKKLKGELLSKLIDLIGNLRERE